MQNKEERSRWEGHQYERNRRKVGKLLSLKRLVKVLRIATTLKDCPRIFAGNITTILRQLKATGMKEGKRKTSTVCNKKGDEIKKRLSLVQVIVQGSQVMKKFHPFELCMVSLYWTVSSRPSLPLLRSERFHACNQGSYSHGFKIVQFPLKTRH